MASTAGPAPGLLKRKDISCTECAKEQPAYKCPTCEKTYCSVECCNRHKLRCQEASGSGAVAATAGTSEEAKRKRDLNFPSEDTIPEVRFLQMKADERLLLMLKGQKLRRMIQMVDESTRPADLLTQCMNDPNFFKFVTVLMDIMKNRDREFDAFQDENITYIQNFCDQFEQAQNDQLNM